MDVHVPTAITEGLRRRGIDVLTAQQARMERASDEALLRFALEERRMIFTQDADFLRLHASGVTHAGIAYVHQQTPIGTVIQGLVLIYEALTPEDIQNRVEFL
ncbi:MAG: DUF5615 family PIN-like protein [Anaerolineae bacterium]